ncbi:MAG: T9SS C-terminal target domain-containing protein, partial [Ignavibacteriaceae bacterium]
MRNALFLYFVLFFVGSFTFAQEVITGNITSDMTLTSDKTYMLRDIVRVQSGATLTIQPGTII